MNGPAKIGRRSLLAGMGATALLGVAGLEPAVASPLPRQEQRRSDGLKLFRWVHAPNTITGLAVTSGGRVFVCLPRYSAANPFTLAEVAGDGSVTAFPDAEMNRPDPGRPDQTLFSTLNCVPDRRGRLWILDSGQATTAEPVTQGAAKLVCVDLATNEVVRTVPLSSVTSEKASPNDLVIWHDPAGEPVRAYISDQGRGGQGALIAVDLTTGRVVRRLAEHASTASQPGGVLRIMEGRHVLLRSADGTSRPLLGGANAIALSPDGMHLYYGPIASRRAYRIDTGRLLDPSASDADLAATVVDLGEKGATAGMITDALGRIYLSLQEFNAVGRRELDGTITVLDDDPRLIWPDTFSITDDGWLYVTAAQANRRPEFNGGVDQQKPPYGIFRIRIGAGPAT